ncbi:hypothetical protein Taro_031815 [Colocasia esculenta]|uniref:RRM domain-containing protein n=1 Tax=Colocasia esculenta TaxID=4460 RepID=A0A843VPU8_COLES|nr:hypothetical protein [Colocasia esculenta]
MPPRSAKKSAAKRPSPRPKKSPLTPSAAASAEVLASVDEEVTISEVPASPAVVAQEDDDEAVEQKPIETESSPPEADAGATSEVNGEEEESEGEEETLAANAVHGSDAVEDDIHAEMEDMGEADDSQEMVEDLEASPRDEGEPFAAPDEAAAGDEQPTVIAEIEDNSVDSHEINSVEGAKKSIVEEGTVTSMVENTEACGLEVGDAIGDGDGRASDNDLDDEDEDEVDPSPYMSAHMTERKGNKELEIFVGGLGKEAVEEDLLKVFSEFGEIQSARIVKHPVTQKSKGFAFIRYATIEEAKKALAGLKDGTEIRGKRVGISASVDNDTLYLGNICKTWTKDQVLDTLKKIVVEPVEEILLPDDPKKEGNNKGFAFLEFGSHLEAMAAFQRLRKADAIFGCNKSAKVGFALFSMHPSKEAMSQVKSVYVEGIPLTWDEEKVKEMCKQYGEVEKVQLSRNFSKNKRKDFGFVAFTSHESAVACIQGINDAELGEEDIKVKASLAKPQRKGRLAKRGVRGGFKVKENNEASEEAGQYQKKSKTKIKERQGKETLEKGKVLSKSKFIKEKEVQKSKGKTIAGKSNAYYHQKNVEPSKGGKRGRKHIDHGAWPSKKARNDFNFHGRPSAHFGSQSNAHYEMMRTTIPYASGYTEPTTGYQLRSYAGASGSNNQRSDLVQMYTLPTGGTQHTVHMRLVIPTPVLEHMHHRGHIIEEKTCRTQDKLVSGLSSGMLRCVDGQDMWSTSVDANKIDEKGFCVGNKL